MTDKRREENTMESTAFLRHASFSEKEGEIIRSYYRKLIFREDAVNQAISVGANPKRADRVMHMISIVRRMGIDWSQEVILQCAQAELEEKECPKKPSNSK